MAFDPEIWRKIETRYKKGETPGKISESLGGKPSGAAISKRAKLKNWEEKKSKKVAELEEKEGEKFTEFLKSQHERYKRITKRFDRTIKDKDKLERPAPVCPVRDLVTLHQDWRILFELQENEKKKTEDAQDERLEKEFLETEEGRLANKQYRERLRLFREKKNAP